MKKMQYSIQEIFVSATVQERQQRVQQLMQTYLHSVMQQIVNSNENKGQAQP